MRDAYYPRSKYLLKKAAELESITGCIVNLQITPTWEKGVKKSYHTKDHEVDFRCDKEAEQQCFDTSTGNITHEIPKKRQQKEKEQDIVNSENVCRVCGIAWESPEDQESDWFWIGCAGKTCKCKPATACKHECDWWVHNRFAHIYYENSDAGETAMSTWAKKHFFGHKHMPDVQKIGWDKELQQDVVLPSNSKKFLKKVIKNKLNK